MALLKWAAQCVEMTNVGLRTFAPEDGIRSALDGVRMSVLQELNPMQMGEALVSICEKHIPIMIMLRRGESWLNLRSRFLAIDGARLVFELPQSEDGTPFDDLIPAEKLQASFKHKHHKHLFSTTVLTVQDFYGPAGKSKAMFVGCPTTMQRIQRRAYFRASVPSNRVVRVSFWFGGCESNPAGTSPERPVWSGVVDDISAGGCQVRYRGDAAVILDTGDTVGLRMTFGMSDETLLTDAQFRHAIPADQGTLIGFQFVGLGQSPEGKNALRIISTKVSEYQRLSLRHRAPL